MWIFCVGYEWIGGVDSPEDRIRRFSVAVVIFNFFAKLVFGAVFCKNCINLGK